MVKFLYSFFFMFFILFISAPNAVAQGRLEVPNTPIKIDGQNISAMDELNKNIHEMTKKIDKASRQMMKIADMIICNASHGAAATVSFETEGFSIKFELFAIDILISGWILYVLGFFMTIIASFYMFDIAFNLSLSILLLPLALALWPFAWTKGKLGIVVKSIAYYTGLFIFLPLGILIGVALVTEVIDSVFPEGSSFIKAFNEDKSDEIRDTLAFYTWGFFKVVLSYLVAMKVLPLMAQEFCNHFFDGALVGDPMNQKMTQIIAVAKQKTIGKVTKFGKDVIKHQTGKGIEKAGNKMGGFMGGVLSRYGRQIGQTRR